MKNSLLNRQIAKHLGDNPVGIDSFLHAIDESYQNNDEKIAMIQRAMKVSSEELFEANEKLSAEAISLKEINTNLEFILDSINMNLGTKSVLENSDYNPSEYIKQQSLEIIKITKQRGELLDNLAKQNEALKDYAHMVSHEIKAPLRNVNTLISWFKEDNFNLISSVKKGELDLVLYNVEKMDLLIDGILNYSTIDKANNETQKIDLNLIVDEILVSIFIPENMNISVKNKLPQLRGNVYRFKQLFKNVIENAIKFNYKPKGCIEIGYSLHKEYHQFYIKDNAKGIPKQYFKKIFMVFYKLESEMQSAGIGLSIVTKIIQYYKGEIWVESIENYFTTFYFKVPKN